MLLLTSHPVEGRDGADKEIAVAVATGVRTADFTWFGRWPARGGEQHLPGRRLPMLSLRGRPEVPEQLQAVLHAARLAPRSDLVHAVMTIGTHFPLLSRAAARRTATTPVLHTVPGVVDPTVLPRCRPLGTTVALSEHTALHLREAGFPDVRVVAPSISLERWALAPLPEGQPVVLFAGHHDRGGGAHEAVEVAAEAHRLGARFRLVLALRSRPGEHAVDQAALLLGRAKAAGLRDVEVLGRVDDMPALVRRASVLLFPPTVLAGKADVPLTVIEALATGRPAVVTDLPHFAALGEAVERVPVQQAEAGGQRLAQVLAALPEHGSRAAARRAVVEEAFSPDRMSRAYEELYAELLEGTPVRSTSS